MRAVLAARTREGAQRGECIELIVAILVEDTIDATLVLARAIDDDVQTVERPQQALCLADVNIDWLDLHVATCSDGGRRHAEQTSVLVRDDQASFGIDAQVHPRPFDIFGNGVEQFDLEVLGDLHVFDRRGRGLFERGCGGECRGVNFLAPRTLSERRDDFGGGPLSCKAKFLPVSRRRCGSLPGPVRHNGPSGSPARL